MVNFRWLSIVWLLGMSTTLGAIPSFASDSPDPSSAVPVPNEEQIETIPPTQSQDSPTVDLSDPMAQRPQATIERILPTQSQDSSTLEVSDPMAQIPQVTIERIPPTQAQDSPTVNLSDPMAQVTNVSQLRDVQPSDWAYEAMRSLVERYGCIAGYPDGTFRGDRSLSRYEFAAGLNACLEQINRLIAATTQSEFISKEDLATVQRLQGEFATDLAILKGRTDALEARTTELELTQFSTTTKLNGLAWFNLTSASAGDDVKVETTDINAPLPIRPAGRENGRPAVRIAQDPNITLSNLVWLTLETSFNGKDSLVTQLAAGNGNSPANAYASAGLYNTFGTPFTDQSGGVDTGTNDVILRELFYQFPVSNNLRVVVGPRVNWYRYFDNNAYNFFLTGSSSFNSSGSTLLNTIDRGAGAVVLWDINQQLRLRVGYLGENDEFLPGGLFNSASNPNQGLFGGTNTTTVELTYSPSNNANLRFLYNRSNIQAIFGRIGGAIGEPIYGFADDGFGGALGNATADTVGVNFDWRIVPKLGIFGRYTYGSTHLDPRTPGRASGDVNAQSFQLGLALPDLGKRGALATLSFLVPFDVLEGERFLVSGAGNGGTQYELEATYFYPITNNIALVPSFYAIANPNNFDDNPTIFVGNLRTQFSF